MARRLQGPFVGFFLSFLLCLAKNGPERKVDGIRRNSEQGKGAATDWRRRWAYDDGTQRGSKQSRQARTPSSASSESELRGATVASLYYFLGGLPIAVSAKTLGALGREKIWLSVIFFSFLRLPPLALAIKEILASRL